MCECVIICYFLFRLFSTCGWSVEYTRVVSVFRSYSFSLVLSLCVSMCRDLFGEEVDIDELTRDFIQEHVADLELAIEIPIEEVH